MKNRRHLILNFAVIALGAAFFVGCVTREEDPSTETLKHLEKTLVQLKAENANLHSRVKSMDDKLLVYRKKDEVASESDQQDALRTVRLSPGDEEELSLREAEEDISLAAEPVQVKEDSERPVLRLVGDQEQYVHPVTSSGGQVQPVATRSYVDIPPVNRGDNLGVVTPGATTEDADNAMAMFHSAYRAYNNRDYASAVAGFAEFLQKESSHAYADNAMFWMGECFLAQGKSMKAVGAFERLLKRYPSSEKAGSALYRIGSIYDQLNDGNRAQDYYFKVVERYPCTEAARKASRRMSGGAGNSQLIRASARR